MSLLLKPWLEFTLRSQDHCTGVLAAGLIRVVSLRIFVVMQHQGALGAANTRAH